jgi:hypothetical protein
MWWRWRDGTRRRAPTNPSEEDSDPVESSIHTRSELHVVGQTPDSSRSTPARSTSPRPMEKRASSRPAHSLSAATAGGSPTTPMATKWRARGMCPRPRRSQDRDRAVPSQNRC